MRRILFCLLIAWSWIARGAIANEGAPSADGVAFFEAKIRPVLVERCYSCHSAEADVLQAGLLVDRRDGLLGGGDSGPAIVPGKPDESLLIAALKYDGFEMPPEGKLPDEVIADFEHWVATGAPDPRTEAADVPQPGIDIEEGRKFWSFQPVKATAPPEVKSEELALGAVDRFLLAKLEAAGLSFAAEADRAAWLRRVTFDLVGLPPTVAELEAFLADRTPDAHARVVDHLLASPHFGERWGRHWLDVARFAESSGGGRSIVFKDAWRYRDYVIDAVNRDKPFNEFIVEQIAGDLLSHDSPREKRDHLVATAYLILGAHNYEEQDKRVLKMDVADEQLDALGRGLLGMTISCARCHDHKFDPIPTADYYALAGILRSTHVLIHENVSKWPTRPLPMEPVGPQALAAYEKSLAENEAKLAEARASKKAKDVPRVKILEKRIAGLKKSGPPMASCMAVTEAKTVEDCRICIRGSVHHRGEVAPRGVLQAATIGNPPQMPSDASGRHELARWIASAKNPLTARVHVNRVWQKLFGTGIVRTVDNFGTTGELPSHPELLDYVADRFVSDGWSTKRLIRGLALSRAYRQTSAVDAEMQARGVAADPENRLLWRMNRRRLDAESLRDAMLVASGRLDRTIGGPNIQDESVLAAATSTNPTEYGYVFADTRRSVYTPAFRNRMHELFEVFDFADQNRAVLARNATTVAPQALMMLNGPFVMEQARAAAARLLAEEPSMSAENRVGRLFVELLTREPSEGEEEAALAAVEGARDQRTAWTELTQAVFATVDFRYLD